MQPAPAEEGLASGSPSPVADPVVLASCPVRHGPAPTGVCPVAPRPGAPSRSRADLVVRKVLRIRDRPAGVTAASAYGAFQRSMLISAVRCTLTYVIFPFVAPAVGFATGVGPAIGVVIGSFAMVCDVFTIRRFFAVDHKWRWPVSTVAFSVICLLSVLWVQDVRHLLR